MGSHKTIDRLLWPLLVVAVVLALVWRFQKLPDASARLDSLPKTGIGFASRDLPVSKVEKEIYGKATLIKRVYSVRGRMMVAIVIDGSANRHAVHDPLFCLRGIGWQVDREADYPLANGYAKLVGLKRNGERSEALYWFTDGNTQWSSPSQYWWEASLRRLSFGKSGNEPVLVVLQPNDKPSMRWDKVLETFTQLQEL